VSIISICSNGCIISALPSEVFFLSPSFESSPFVLAWRLAISIKTLLVDRDIFFFYFMIASVSYIPSFLSLSLAGVLVLFYLVEISGVG
jgi:hypothetical protein